MMQNSQSHAIEVYTDAQCPLCLWVRARVEPLDRDGRIKWLDYRDPQSRAGEASRFTFAEMNDAMHVRRMADGQWSKGYDAWIEVLRVLPRGWRWLGRFLSLWPLRALGPYLYRFIARHRFSLFGAPPPCDAHGVCSLHSS
jgi:predicted DCC family thiol-disulfide oxidoreductase YuxK